MGQMKRHCLATVAVHWARLLSEGGVRWLIHRVKSSGWVLLGALSVLPVLAADKTNSVILADLSIEARSEIPGGSNRFS